MSASVSPIIHDAPRSSTSAAAASSEHARRGLATRTGARQLGDYPVGVMRAQARGVKVRAILGKERKHLFVDGKQLLDGRLALGSGRLV